MKIQIIFLLFFCFLVGCKPSQKQKDRENKWVHIASKDEPISLDPRQEDSIPSKTILHALYEGLMRYNMHGEPIPALVKKIEVSPEKTTYTFFLKKTNWSNGDPLTSFDFVSTWKQLLQPHFPSKHVELFNIIKGAKEFKEGKISWEQVGIKTPDPYTLIIELESPTPFFLDLLCTHYFYPVHSKFPSHPLISNGPFILNDWKSKEGLILEKNPKYWDSGEVKLQKLYFQSLDEYAAIRLFEDGKIEWAGSPMSTLPKDTLKTLKYRHQIRTAPAAGIHWLKINTENGPLQSSKLRKALAYALNRKSMIEQALQGNQKPATALIPTYKPPATTYFVDNNTADAWYLFQEALEEMHLSIDSFPALSLCYLKKDTNDKIAKIIKDQWKKTLGIEILLEECEPTVFLDRIKRLDYKIALDFLFAASQDPFEILKEFTFWNNKDFTQLLKESSKEFIPMKRKNLLTKAEGLLIAQMPVIPLYFDTYNYVKSDGLFGVYFSALGYLDFKYAFYED